MKNLTLIEYMIIIAIVGIILAVFIPVINFANMPVNSGGGLVVGKTYVAPTTTTTYVKSGEVMVPHTTHYEEKYKIKIEVDGKYDSFHAHPAFYDRVSVGDFLQVKYQKGRFFGGINIKSVEEEE